MEKLVLFDIDGTLIDSPPNNLHNRTFEESVKNIAAQEVVVPHGKYSGLTDRLILSALLDEAGVDTGQVSEVLPSTMAELERIYLEKFQKGSITLLPGINVLLKELHSRRAVLGLVTGNLEEIARTKFEDVGIYHYFKTGGFGSDPHNKRSDLVKIAVEKAGFTLKNNPNVYLVGDTPRDIQAGQEAGVANKIGVATHTSTEQQLKESGADITFNDLADTEAVLRALDMS